MNFQVHTFITSFFGKKKLAFMLALLCSFYAFGQKIDRPVWYEMGDNKGFTFYEVQQAFNEYWAGKKIEKGKGYKVFKRWENTVAPRVYPSGDLSLLSQTYPNFLEWQRENGVSARNSAGNWTQFGPVGAAITSPPGGDTGAGRTTWITFDPTNSATMFAGTPDGGLWKSTNSGTTWTTNTDLLSVIGTADLAIDPGNTSNMYLATGDRGSDRRSRGVLKTTNGGSAWSTTGLTWTDSDNYKARKMVMDPTNSSIMLLCTDGGIFKTTDGWTTWSNSGSQCCVHFRDIEFKPGDPNIVYTANEQFWKSTDKGDTWTQITTGLPGSNIGRIVLGVSAANPAYVYALIGRADNSGFLGLYRSTDSGASFTLQSSTPNILGYTTDGSDMSGQAFHDLAIAVSPADANILVIGGVNQWKSTDGGVNWTLSSHWSPGNGFPFVHADIQDIVYKPGNNTTLVTACDGGVYTSPDNGANWTDITNNFAIAQVTNIGVSASNASLMLAGLQDIGSIKRDAGTWSLIPGGGGDGEDCFIDRTSNLNMVATGVYGAHDLSTDGGVTFNSITSGLPTGSPNQWICPISQDPLIATTLYAGGRPAFYRSTNMGTSWTALGTPFGTNNILEFAVAPSNTTIIYALYDGGIAKSTNGGTSWSQLTLATGGAALTHLAISNTDPNKVWVTCSGYVAGNKVFKTINGGSSWTNISGGLPNIPMNRIVAVNGSGDAVYVGADIGVYYKDFNQANFISFLDNLPNVSVRDLEIYYPTNKIRAATYGRSTWESDLFAAPFAIELVSFDVRLEGKNTARIDWKTGSETNNRGFEIEMAQNGGAFQKMGFVNGKGTTVEANSYQFEVPNLTPDLYFFRLKIMDFDGKSEFSPVQSLRLTGDEETLLIFPNPSRDGAFQIELANSKSEQMTVEISNTEGRQLGSSHFSNLGHAINLQLPGAGTFNLKITLDNGKEFNRRVVSLK